MQFRKIFCHLVFSLLICGFFLTPTVLVCFILCTIETSAATLYNAALNRPAFQSSLYNTHWPASLANDGDHGTTQIVDNIGKCAASKDEVNPWWAVDLGHELHVHSVLLTNRGDCCGVYFSSLLYRAYRIINITQHNIADF